MTSKIKWFVASETSQRQWCGLRPSVLGQDWSETQKIGLGLGRTLSTLESLCRAIIRKKKAWRHPTEATALEFPKQVDQNHTVIAWVIAFIKMPACSAYRRVSVRQMCMHLDFSTCQRLHTCLAKAMLWVTRDGRQPTPFTDLCYMPVAQ